MSPPNVPVFFGHPSHLALEYPGPLQNRAMYGSFRGFAGSRQHTLKGDWREIDGGLKNNHVFGNKENHQGMVIHLRSSNGGSCCYLSA